MKKIMYKFYKVDPTKLEVLKVFHMQNELYQVSGILYVIYGIIFIICIYMNIWIII